MTITCDAIDEYTTRTAVPRAGSIDTAIDRYISGAPVVVGHHTGALLLSSGAAVGISTTARMISRGSGMIFVAMERDRLQQLRIPAMASDSRSLCPGCHVAVDAADGIGTGISAHDRTETIRRLADLEIGPDALNRPGHVIPVAADLVVGTVPSASQVVLMFAALAAPLPRVAPFTALVSEERPCEMATAAEGAAMAAERDWAYVDAAAVTTAYYWTAG